MNPSGYNIIELVREAQTRWLKPAEVLFILQSHDSSQITNEPPQKPPSGSLFLFNKRVLRFFRKDGHSWRRKKDGRTVGEAHERLKVGNVEAINCYYAHGEHNPNFQRRSYWMLDPAHDHIVLVHYRDINEGSQNAGVTLQSSPVSITFSPTPSSYSNQPLGSSMGIGESYEPYVSSSSPGSVEITSDAAVRSDGINYLDSSATMEEVNSSANLEMNQALKRLEEQLSLNDERFQELDALDSENEDPDDFGPVGSDQSSLAATQLNPNGRQSWKNTGDNIHNQQLVNHEANVWGGVLDTYGDSQNVGIQTKYVHKSDVNGEQHTVSRKEDVEAFGTYTFLDFGGKNAQNSTAVSQDVEGFVYHPYPPSTNSYHSDPNDYATLFDLGQNRDPLEDGLSLTISQKQKFSIQEISPEWGYASETTKVIIVGSFLCDPSETVWTCMLGDIEVPVQIIRDGVMSCLAPPHFPGKVTLCITSSNRESCSEIREFEYRVNPADSAPKSQPEAGFKSPEELLLMVRFVQTLLSNSQLQKGDSNDLKLSFLSKTRAGDDSWGQVIEALLFGTWTAATTTDWLLQELLKDKLQQWLYSRSQELNHQLTCSLSRKEQGIIHMIAGLGFEWALHPILSSGVNINFRDINGWTALHWAARFGREKMVAELMASGASAGAVTDPSSHDPVGKTPASIAATYGHHGLAGYLSEVALTTHLSSLRLKESELSQDSADVEAERTVSGISRTTNCTSEDQLSLKQGLAAVRSATQAAARIQSAFRAHSFRKRQVKEAFSTSSFTFTDGDEYEVLSNDIQGLSAASKLAFRNSRDYNSAAVSIQKKYRGWKGRKDFLSFRQKVVKIQAHVRGYQVRRNYKVCWATGILEKVVLRWRRRGVGLRGFRHESDSIDETEDEDILKVFRKQKVDAAIDEAVSRVLLMVECPDARQQYRRILEKYRQAKAELEGTAENEKTEASNNGLAYMENDGSYLLV
ncbi:DNA-binding transcription factor [Lithospermum erythrorhizon]|uniref:DNA-binding transcription factor n=1 Tax=Lithospermum erythrorhizon TaxID=34254 RepID=A0AAV3PQZ5_LITER